MKSSNIVLGLQTVAMGLLIWQITTLQRPAPAQTLPAASPTVPTTPPSDPTTHTDPALITAIRQVLRQELSRSIPTATVSAQDATEPVTATGFPDPVEQQLRWEWFEQELDHYLSRGDISADEMQQLQSHITRLHPEDRKTAVIRIGQAINSGRLDGRF